MHSKTSCEQPPLKGRQARAHRQTTCLDLTSQLYRIAGVDLTQIDGIQVQTCADRDLRSGVDMSRWRTEKQFTSRLGLCPDNRISGGKVLKRGTRHVVNRAAPALRMAAWKSVSKSKRAGSQFQKTADKTGRAESNHGSGSQTCQTRLPDVEIWPGIC